MRFQQGKLRRATKVVLYGTEGVGKTTFASQAPTPVFLDCEGGTDLFDVGRFQCSTWNEIMEAINWLYSNEHEYRTCVVDTSSAAERMAQQHVCRLEGKDSIEAFGYGKGFTRTAEAYDELIRGLDALIFKGMNVVILAHADVKPFSDPEGGDYDRWHIRSDRRIGPKIKEWADAVLFADHDKSVQTKGEGFGQRTVAKSWGERIMWTEHRATHDAKNRFGLPERMPLSWTEFQAGVDAFYT